MKKTFVISGYHNIPNMARELASKLRGGEVFALVGELGAGKTTFVKAVGKSLKIKKTITSPSFVIMNVYPFKSGGKNKILVHLDLYRTKKFLEVKALGLKELWNKKDTITFIEWGDKIKKHLPKNTKIINFTHDKNF